MKKFLRFIGILLLLLIVGFLVLCAVSPSEIKVERSTMINAPKAVVFDQIVHFKNWEHWNAWKEMDTTIVVDISGTDGQEGAQYHYVGKMAGEGITHNTGVSDGEMKYRMDFIEPFKGEAEGYYKVVEEGGKTKTIWYFHEKNMGFIPRGISAIMGAEKMLTKTFDRGLEMLKNYSEAHAGDAAANMAGMAAITEMQYPAHIYAGIRKNVAWADMHNFFSNAYATLGKEAGQRITGPSAAVYYAWDTVKMSGDILACFPVADDVPVKDASIVKVPASLAYKMVYVGPYNGFMDAHRAMGEKIAASGKKQGLVIEEYIKTPATETDSNKYETNIIYLVQ